MKKRILAAAMIGVVAATAATLAACVQEPPESTPGSTQSTGSVMATQSTPPIIPTTQPSSTQTQPTTQPVGSDHVHVYGEWNVVQQANCTQGEISRRVCQCGHFEEKEVGLPTGEHVYDEAGNCTGCERRVSVGLFYKLNQEKTAYTLIGIGSCEDQDVIIPEVYNGKPVTAIRDYAFASMGNTPSAVRSITIPGTVETIGKGVFAGCENLTEIHVDPENAYFACLESILFTRDQKTLLVYPGGKREESFRIPDHVETVGDFAFAYCSGLKQVTISDSVTAIGEGAFGSSSIEIITFGAGMQHLGPQVFALCKKLTAIEVSASNPNFSSSDGVLMHKDGSVLYVYPAGKTAESYQVPQGVTVIAPEAFYGCLGLKKVSLPTSVREIAHNAFYDCSDLQEAKLPGVQQIRREAFAWCTGLVKVTFGEQLQDIGENAFAGCTWLEEVALPESLKTLGRGAFGSCDRLKSVIFAGTVEQWLQIEKQEAWDGLYSGFDLYCRDMMEYSEGLDYVLGEDGTYTVTGLGSCQDPVVIVPALHKGQLVTGVGELAFAQCQAEEIRLPDTVITIGGGCFSNCLQLKTIVLGSQVSTIADHVFNGCLVLSQIQVSEDSVNYVSIEGVLYTKNMDTLVTYPEGKKDAQYVVPEGVKNIHPYAFLNCDLLTQVQLPESLERIGNEAFSDCDGLESVQLHSFIQSIGQEAFYDCENLEVISYGGTVAQWEEVRKGELWNANSPKLQILCTDGEAGRQGWSVIGTMGGDDFTVDIPMAQQMDGTWVTVHAIAMEAGDTFFCRLGGSWDSAFPEEAFTVENSGSYFVMLDPNSGAITLILAE